MEVACALPDEQFLLRVRVRAGATLREAIQASGILQRFPQIDLERAAIGVFGSVRGLEDPVAAGDRIEIYRALAMDPKQARRRRAARGR